MAETRGETDLSVNDNEKKGGWLGMYYAQDFYRGCKNIYKQWQVVKNLILIL